MSLTFYGAFSGLFYTMALGAIWPSRGDMDFSTALLDLIAKSLWLSWLVVVLSFFLNLPNPIKPLCAGVGAAIVVQAFLHRRVLLQPGATALPLVIALGVSAILFFGGLGSAYEVIFLTNDAVVSWNRWGVELSKNVYNPWNAAYPVLFPGVWSLIYKAQQSASVWVFAKLTLFVLVLILGLLVGRLLSCGLIICAAALAVFSAFFFVGWHAFPLLKGDMDIPVSVMCLAACVSILVVADHIERTSPETGDSIILAALFVGLATITKQPGVTLLVPFFVLLAIAWWTKAITGKISILVMAIALVPLATFLAVYFTREANAIGNLEVLRNITQRVAKDRHPLQLATEHLVVGSIPAKALLPVIGCTLLNLVNVRRLSNKIGLLLLALSVVGFLQYANCCAYDTRNVWWVVALLFGSALFGLKNLDVFRVAPSAAQSWPAAYLRGALLCLSILIGLAVADRIPDATIAEVQVREQARVLGPNFARMFKTSFLPIQDPSDVLISENGIAEWLPGMTSNFVVCGSTDRRCFVRAAKQYPEARMFVLIERGNLEYPIIADRLTEEYLIGKAQPFELYGPFSASELARAAAPP